MGKVLNPAKPVNGRKAVVTINPATLVTSWHGIEVGKRFKVTRQDGIESASYYFIASAIEPTAPDSDYAWVTGTRVNGRGATHPSHVSHLHCGENARQELVHVSMVKGGK